MSRKKTNLDLLLYKFVFVNGHCCCVRVSASNFQVLTRKRGGGRDFGNVVRFLADPARAYTQPVHEKRLRLCTSKYAYKHLYVLEDKLQQFEQEYIVHCYNATGKEFKTGL